MPIIEVDKVSKVYPRRRGAKLMLGRGGLGDWIRGKKASTFSALEDLSFTVDAGETLGIIGRNGSGKSTLLKLLAGVSLPSSGEIRIQGRVASLLELGAGFHPMLTGRENIYLNAGLLGMRHAEVDEIFEEIVAFSGIRDFIDQPVDTYSSGMYVRIGFAVAAHTNPGIFLIDEVLSVGDEEFQRKCRRKIGELREQGKTILFVSHDLGIVNTLCQRLILLEQGRMLLRETPQKTIAYYLRRIGREEGVHSCLAGETEAVFCEGRISIFDAQEELTAPGGLQLFLTNLGQRHASTEAEWRITESSAAGCKAVGRMTRLPVSIHWEIQAAAGKLSCRCALACEEATTLSEITALLQLPVAYRKWIHGDFSGAFPDILPQDQSWTPFMAPDPSTQEGAVVAEGAKLPPLHCRVRPIHPVFRFYWANAEYTAHSRLLVIQGLFPQGNAGIESGVHPLFELDLDTTLPLERIVARMQEQRIVRAGRLSARFESGKMRLAWEEREITQFLHCYTSFFIAHLWHDSTTLQWRAIHLEENRLKAVGDSRRFPFQLRWEVSPKEERLHLRLTLIAREAFEVEEYQVSLLLDPGYTAWQSDHEEGAFPAFDATLDYWTHLNTTYAPGRRLSASGPDLPTVCLKVEADAPEFRMTALNTEAGQNARVLQALRASNAGLMRFAPGEHDLFSGFLSVGEAQP